VFLDSNVLGQEDLVGERELRGGVLFLDSFSYEPSSPPTMVIFHYSEVGIEEEVPL